LAQILAIGRKLQTFRALRHRDFRWFWIGANAQALARGMQFLILGWLVLELTDSASRMGFMIFLYGIPTLGFVLFGGTFADRFDRRGLLMLTQALVGLLVLGLAVLETAGLVALWHIYAAAFVLGALQAINTPTRLAIVRDLVDRDDLMNAVVLNSAVMNSGRILGPALAGGVIELAGITPALYLAAGGFGVGTVTLLMVRRAPLAARDPRSTILSELWGGLRYCWSNPVTFTVIGIGFAFGFFAMPYAQLLPAFAKLVLDTGAGGAGLLITGAGIGSLSGTIIMASMGNSPHKSRLLLACIFLFGISLFCLGWSHWFWMSWAILFLVGMGSIVPMGTTVLQLSVPAELQGRVMSVWYISAGFMFIGSYPMTLVAEYISWTAAFSGGAAIYLTVAFVLGVWRPTLRRLRV
jgi:MFS family permease